MLEENQVRNFKIGANIRRIREFRGYKQDYVANKLEMSQQNYSKIERGETDFTDEKLEQIADVLEVKPSLFEGLDEKTVFNHNVLNDQSQLNYFGTGHLYNNQMKTDEVEIRRLMEDNKNFLLEIDKLSKELAQLRPLINDLVNNSITGVV